MPTLELWTDGAYSRSSGFGGWACIAVRDGQEVWRISGRVPDPTTNNRMELTGILQGLAVCAKLPDNVIVYTDSKYSITVINAPDEARPVIKNGDLIRQCRSLLRGARISRRAGKARDGTELRWIKGHAGHFWNEAADKLATAARDGKTLA